MNNQGIQTKVNKLHPQNSNNSSRTLKKAVALATVLLGLGLVMPAFAGNAPLPGHSTAFGKSLAQWQELYWRWVYGQITIPQDANGNTVGGANVVLMSIPPTPGDGTPGSLDVTLNSGQAFMLPLWNLLGNAYVDGSSDALIALAVFQTLDFELTLDGVTIMDSSNLMQYYSQFYFDPPIPYNVPPAVSFIWFQDIGMVHAPLSVGTHTLKLDAQNTDTEDLFGLVFAYHNTWHVNVQPAK